MLKHMLSGKIHRATITATNIDYEGSITIDRRLMEAAGLAPGELVQILNAMNGTRMETYVIAGKALSGIVCLNGAAARWAEPGDKVIILSYVLCDEKEARRHRPRVVRVDDRNRIIRTRKR